MRKKISIFLAGAAVCLCAAWYWYNKPRVGVAHTAADVVVTAAQLYGNYQSAETEANKIYLDKTIEVKGTVDDMITINKDVVIMLGAGSPGGISCRFSPGTAVGNMAIKKGMQVVIKGRCTGFNIDVNLVDCIVIL
jgi:hypothetical protein